jgi:hypothetical protein
MIINTAIQATQVPTVITTPFLTTDKDTWVQLYICKITTGDVFFGTNSNILNGSGFPLGTEVLSMVVSPNTQLYIGTTSVAAESFGFIVAPLSEMLVADVLTKLLAPSKSTPISRPLTIADLIKGC